MPDPIPSIVESLDAVPEALHPFYSETESGGFSLNFDGAPKLKSAAQAARAERDKLDRELKALQERYGDLDPTKARDALEKIEKLEAERDASSNGNNGHGDSEQLKQFQAQIDGLTKKLEKTEKEREAEKQLRLEREAENRKAAIRDHIREELRKRQDVHPDAHEDILLRAQVVDGFTGLDDHGAFQVDKEGEPVYDDDGQPMRVKSWLDAQLKQRSSWRLERTGTGDGTTSTRSSMGGTMTPEEVDHLIKTDFPKFERLRKEGKIR